MSRNQKVGQGRKQTAADQLSAKGNEIITRNGRSPHGEIDLIAQKDGVTVFVEVKARASSSVGWHQSDYLKIVAAVFQHVWKDTPTGWNYYNLQFGSNCQDSPSGFDYARFTYMKTIKVGLLNNEYAVLEVDIFPSNNLVSWGGDANYAIPIWPNDNNWPNIDPPKVKVNADDALQIAEDNGAALSRLKFNNHCLIAKTLSADGWMLNITKIKLPVQRFFQWLLMNTMANTKFYQQASNL